MKCLVCGNENEADLLFCTECGQELTDKLETASKSEFKKLNSRPSMTLICSNCQKKREVTDNYCEFCGYSFNKVNAAVSEETLTENLKEKVDYLWIFIIVIAAILAFGLGYQIAIR